MHGRLRNSVPRPNVFDLAILGEIGAGAKGSDTGRRTLRTARAKQRGSGQRVEF